jgi:hypothetical protein
MSDLLERMRRNPVGDWAIRDIEAVCREFGINCPFRRPVKPVYIRKLVRFVEAVRNAAS